MSIVVLDKKFNKMILNEIWLVFNHETISFVLTHKHSVEK